MKPKPAKRKKESGPTASDEETLSKSSESHAKRVRWDAEIEEAEEPDGLDEDSDEEGSSQEKVRAQCKRCAMVSYSICRSVLLLHANCESCAPRQSAWANFV